MNIAAILFGIIKAVPAAMELYNNLESLIIKYRLSQITDEYSMKRDKTRALMASIAKADTNEDRRALSQILNDITHGNYSSKLPK